MTVQNRRRTGGILLIGAAAAMVAVITLLVPGITPWSPPASATTNDSCMVVPLALNPADTNQLNPDIDPNSFGPDVTVRGRDAVLAELKERRTCGANDQYDPFLTAAHYSEWSHYGLTSVTVGETTAEIDAYAAKIMADSTLYAATLAELEKLEGESAYSEEGVSAGIWSLYMEPNGNGGVRIGVGHTVRDGTNAVFTHGDVKVYYRLDCGFQPNRVGGYPGMDVIEPAVPATPAVPNTPPAPPAPPAPPTPPCYDNCPKFVTPGVRPPDGVNVQPNDPYEPPESVAPPAVPAPVQSANTNHSSNTPAQGTVPNPPVIPYAPPATGTTPDGGTGSVNPTDPVTGTPGANEGDPGNPFG